MWQGYFLFGLLLAANLLAPTSGKLNGESPRKPGSILNLAFTKFKLSGLKFFNDIKCAFYECCQEPYLQLNLARLEQKLSSNLYGQPLVKKTLYTALKGHYSLKNPKKALVLSFHGSTGVGKSFC